MRSKNGTLGVVFATVFLDLAGYGMLIPVQPFLAERFGASPSTVTALASVFAAMQILMAPVWGRLADRWGRRPVLLTSLAMATLGHACFALAGSLVGLFISRVIAGIGSGNFAIAQAALGDATSETDRAKAMGRLGAVIGLGFILGPALGGALAQWGLWVPAAAAALIGAVDFAFAWRYLPETRDRALATSAAEPVLSTLSRLWLRPDFVRLFFVYALFSTAFAMVQQVAGLFVERVWLLGGSHEAAAGQIAQVFLVIALLSVVVQAAAIDPLVRRFGEKPLLVVGLGLASIGFCLLPASGTLASWPLLIAAAGVVGLGTGFINPTLTSLGTQAVDPTTRAGDLGVAQMFSDLGRVGGPLAGGFLFGRAIESPFWAGAAAIAVSALIAGGLRATSSRAERSPRTCSAPTPGT